jgi:hypothetical protein
VPKPDAEELAGILERCAAATWAAWVDGTGQPAWHELDERTRERVRLASRAGLAAVGLTPEGGAEP